MSRFSFIISLQAVAVSLVMICGADTLPAASLIERPAVDRRPAIVAGQWTVSAYLVRKYFGRFADEFQRKHKRAPTLAEKRAWLEAFVAKQVIVAQAAAMGYLERLEVRQTVARMERHMLTQPAGPFYQTLFPPKQWSEDELVAWHRKSSTVRELLVARFQSEQIQATVLGPDFSSLTLDEQRRRLLLGHDAYGVEVSKGRQPWPFFPFSEVANVIEDAGENGWIFHRDQRLGIYAIFVRRLGASAETSMSQIPPNFQVYADQITRNQRVRLRRVEVLMRSKLAFNTDVAKKAIASWRAGLAGAVELPPLPDPTLAASVLFYFTAGTDRIPVSVETFRQQFNAEFIRALPQNVADLRARAEDFVVEEIDFRAAKAYGIDATPQFVEDRHGFAGYQVLELYEKEHVWPRLLRPTDSEVENYYRAHANDYSQTTKLRARRLKFATVEAALQWQNAASAKKVPIAPPLSDTEVEIVRNHRRPEVDDVAQAVLLTGHPGQLIGPIPDGGGAVVYLIESRLATEVLPLSAVAGSIRQTVEAEALDREEKNLCRKFVRQFHFEDRIDYASYALSESITADIR
jgi:hypothetical protein